MPPWPRPSLPAEPTLEAYVSSHQAAIGQLAVEYCHALMESSSLRGAMFPGFDFDAAPAAAFANENLLFDPLLNRVLGVTQLTHQPDKTFTRQELSNLVHGAGDPARPGLMNAIPAGEGNDAARTRNIAKGVCAAVIGSAAMLIQ